MLRWRVKEVAEAKGVSVKELAQRSGVSSRTIRRLYREPFHYTKVMTWAKLARALEVPRSVILEETPSREGEERMSAHQEGASRLGGEQEAIMPVAERLESARGEDGSGKLECAHHERIGEPVEYQDGRAENDQNDPGDRR